MAEETPKSPGQIAFERYESELADLFGFTDRLGWEHIAPEFKAAWEAAAGAHAARCGEGNIGAQLKGSQELAAKSFKMFRLELLDCASRWRGVNTPNAEGRVQAYEEAGKIALAWVDEIAKEDK